MEAVQKFLRRPAVEEITGLDKSVIYKRIAEGKFPKPVPLEGKQVAWVEAEIIQWQKARIAARDEQSRGDRKRRRRVA